MKPFILASASPRRRDLLTAVGLQFRIRPPAIDESILPYEPPLDYVRRMAAAKAEDVWSPSLKMAVLASDTVVFLGQEIFGKPSSLLKAKEMLTGLSGKVHQVATAFCLMPAGEGSGRLTVVVTEVSFRDLSQTEIERYLALGESMDKAGAYAVQGAGAFLVDEIKGSFTNVIGLPLPEVLWALEKYSN